MADNMAEIRGLAFIEDRVVMVGKATPTKDHGEPCWICTTCPPLKDHAEVVIGEREVVAWLEREARADQILWVVHIESADPS